MTVGHSSGERSYLLNTPRRKEFIRKTSRTKNSAKSIARSVLSDSEVMKYLSVGIGKQLKYELKKLATMNVNSIQRSSNKSDIVHFPWVTIYSEVKEHCPILLSLLNTSTQTKTPR